MPMEAQVILLCSHSIMVLHTLGKGETQVQFLLGAPICFIGVGTKSLAGCLNNGFSIKFFSVVPEGAT